MKVLLFRSACVLIAGMCLLASLDIGSLRSNSPDADLTPLAWVALMLTVATACGCLTLAALSRRRLLEGNRIARTFAVRLQNAPPPVAKRQSTALFVLAAISYLTLLLWFLPLNRAADEGVQQDQWAYLLFARDVHEKGGAGMLPVRLFAGEFEEANRHPLYIGLLALAPTFESGKHLSAGIGLLAFGVLGWGVARRFGSVCGGLFAVLLATNFAFVYHSVLIACEGLLVLGSGLVWLMTERISLRSRAALHPDDDNVGTRPWVLDPWSLVLTGMLLGFTYLTKGSGILLLLGFLVWRASTTLTAAHASPREMLKSLGAGAAITLASWGLVASPLLVRNVRLYGNPLFNVNTYQLFADEFEYDLTRPGHNTTQLARSYFREHSLAEIATRELRGLIRETFILFRTLGPSPLGSGRAVVGGALFVACLVGILAEGRTGRLLVLIWIGLFLAFFAWYVPIAPGDRFVLPLIVPLLAYGSNGILRSFRIMLGVNDRTLASGVVAGGFLWCGIWVALTLLSHSLPFRFPGGE